MGSDILYLEKSNLFAKKLINTLPKIQWLLINDEEKFFDAIFKERPLLIIVGDTGSTSLIELLFGLKSINEFNKIPVIFYGENEYQNILPVKIQISRENEKDDPRKLAGEKNAILNLIKTEQERRDSNPAEWNIPKNYKEPNFLRNNARSILYEELFQGYLYNEISGINIVDISFNEALTKLCQKLEELLLVDFVSIIYIADQNISKTEIQENINKKLSGILHMSKRVPSETLSQLIDHSISQLDPIHLNKRDNVKVQTEPSKPLITINFADIDFVFNEKLQLNGFDNGVLIMGNYSKSKKYSHKFPKNLSTKVLEHSHDLIEKAARYYEKIDENQIIFKAFCQFLPAPIIDDLLLKESEKALLTGEKRNIVVLFSHIHHFDQIVESNEPQRVVDFLNSHFSRMVKIIQSYGGTIDKFIGDAIFAIFGAPISYIDNAQRAANAAIDMISEFNNTSLIDIKLPIEGLTTGVGLNEGEAIIGNIGCSDKFDYTAIGDTVNLAARLESLTKHYKQDILMSKIVAESLNKEHYCRLIDRAKVKGKNEATEIYSLIVKQERYTEEWKILYNKGLKMYTLGNWYTAAEYFNAALKEVSYDPVCRILLSRCLEFQDKKPENWDGAVALDFK